MEFGIELPNAVPFSADEVVAVARAAHAADLAALWVGDEDILPAQPAGRRAYAPGSELLRAPGPRLGEALGALAYAAGGTLGLKLGVSLRLLPERSLVQIAEQLAALDALAESGLILGISAGWLEEEFAPLQALAPGRRSPVLDEYVARLRAGWLAARPGREGVAYPSPELLVHPAALPRGVPPIWLDGHGGASLQRASLLGDGWQGAFLGPVAFARVVRRFRQEAERAGRAVAALTLSARVRLAVQSRADALADGELIGPPSLIAERIRRYAETGVSHLVFRVGRGGESATAILRQLERFALHVRPLLG